MTPDERTLLTQFLSDLTKTQGAAKDPEAAQLIDQAFRTNPDAAYVLTQHALLADQALHQAQQQIEALQAERAQSQQPPQPQSSFFGSAGLGPRVAQPNGPQVTGQGYASSQGYASPSSPWAQAAQPGYAPPPPQSGGFFGGGPLGGQQSGLGSFLQSAGATAAGVAGGAFLFEGLSNLFGGHHGMGGMGMGGGFGGMGGGLGGMGGGFGGGGNEVENVTINNYGDSDDTYDDNDPGSDSDIGGDDYS